MFLCSHEIQTRLKILSDLSSCRNRVFFTNRTDSNTYSRLSNIQQRKKVQKKIQRNFSKKQYSHTRAYRRRKNYNGQSCFFESLEYLMLPWDFYKQTLTNLSTFWRVRTLIVIPRACQLLRRWHLKINRYLAPAFLKPTVLCMVQLNCISYLFLKKDLSSWGCKAFYKQTIRTRRTVKAVPRTCRQNASI